MSAIDWLVLTGTILFIVLYGTIKSRKSRNSENFLKGDGGMKWWHIGISVMATQASAITFISTPGQAFSDGMGFVQFYFGLPLAMIVICIFFIPVFYKLNVTTAYEYLEQRFDLKTRRLTAFFFLLQRGVAAGITIYAPSILLSTVLGVNINFTNIFIGLLVVIYTVAGGAKAVNITQRQQMFVMIGGMMVALGIIIYKITREVSFGQVLHTAGALQKLNLVDWKFDPSSRYNVWSGIFGGFFLALSYFGTDQSQVGRYLGGSSVKESRLGLLFNGVLKIPMQLLILFTGVMVFVFYLYVKPPVFYNRAELKALHDSPEYSGEINRLEEAYSLIYADKQEVVRSLSENTKSEELRAQYNALDSREKKIREDVKSLASKNNKDAVTKDADYVFITFVMDQLPVGVVGLLFAVIFCAAMSSKASELSALAASSLVDFYKRSWKKDGSDRHYLKTSKAFIVIWGIISIIFATIFPLFDNLIQAVNIIGSLFYGTMLGIFITGFVMKKIGSTPVFIAGVISEVLIITLALLNEKEIISLQYLWLNPIGCFAVMGIAFLLQQLLRQKEKGPSV